MEIIIATIREVATRDTTNKVVEAKDIRSRGTMTKMDFT